MTADKITAGDRAEQKRYARLAEELRANLARRKAQARARRAGEADTRPQGLPLSPPQEGTETE